MRPQRAILLRDSFGGTPHQIVNSLQVARKASIGDSSYSQQRDFLKSDLAAADVPPPIIDKVLKECDAEVAELYRQLADKVPEPEMKKLFGDWKAG